MKRYFGMVAATILAACGSSNNNPATNAPPLTNFTYPAPTTPTQTQAATATNAQTSLDDITAAASSNDPSSAQEAPELADDIGDSLLGAAQVAISKNPKDVAAHAGKGLFLAQKNGQLDSGCYVSSGNTLTYDNCDYSSDGFTYTANGSLTVSSSSVTWNLTFTVSESDSEGSFNWTGLWTGTIDYTATTINGSCLSQNSGTYNEDGQSGSFAWTVGLDFIDLTTSPNCDVDSGGNGIVSGTLEIRANTTGNLNIYGYTQEGAEFIWTACDTVGYTFSSSGG